MIPVPSQRTSDPLRSAAEADRGFGLGAARAFLDTDRVILEAAVLTVRAGQHVEFERAFGSAKRIIAAMPGFLGLELQRCVETPGRYLLLVRWRSIEDHTEGFRGSPSYQDWKDLLHHFYEPFPTVEHYELADDASPSTSGDPVVDSR